MLKVGKYKAAFLTIKEIKKKHINSNSLKLHCLELIFDTTNYCRVDTPAFLSCYLVKKDICHA